MSDVYNLSGRRGGKMAAWADETIRTLTKSDWREYNECGGTCTVSPVQCRALLAARDRLIAGLERRDISELVRWSESPPPRAIRAELLDDARALGLADFTGLTPLGHECARVLKVGER